MSTQLKCPDKLPKVEIGQKPDPDLPELDTFYRNYYECLLTDNLVVFFGALASITAIKMLIKH